MSKVVYTVVQADYDSSRYDSSRPIASFTEKKEAEEYVKHITEFMSTQNEEKVYIVETTLNPTIQTQNRAEKLIALFNTYFPKLHVEYNSKEYAEENLIARYSINKDEDYYNIVIVCLEDGTWHSFVKFLYSKSIKTLCTNNTNAVELLDNTKTKFKQIINSF